MCTRQSWKVIWDMIDSEAPRVGGAPQLRKCSNLPMRENLEITWPYTERANDRPSAPHAYQCKITQSTVWQPKSKSRFYLEGNHMAARTFTKKKQQQSRVFFGVIFYVYTNVDNRERARASYWKQRRRTWKFKGAVRKWEMLAASKVEMSGSEK